MGRTGPGGGVPTDVDFAFVVDASASMRPRMAAIRDFIERAPWAVCSRLDARVTHIRRARARVIAFRDFYSGGRGTPPSLEQSGFFDLSTEEAAFLARVR